MIFNRAVHLKAVKGHSLLQALYQLMTALHFPLISLVMPLLALQPNLWLKHLSFPDQHLSVKANRTTQPNWPYVIISPKWSLIYVFIEASKGGADSWWAQSHSLCSDMEVYREEEKAQTQTRLTVQLTWESKRQGRKAPPVLRSQHKENLPQQRNQKNNFIKRQRGFARPWELETRNQAGTALQSTLTLGPDNSLHLCLTHRELQELLAWAVPLPQTS